MADRRDDFIIALRYALLKKGTKQKFSLFFLFVLSILILSLDRLSIPFIKTTRAVLNDFVYEVAVIASAPIKFVSYLSYTGRTHFNVVKKNNNFKEEIEMLKNERNNILFLKTENKSLKEALDLSDTISKEQGTAIVAKVILDQESPYLKSLLINKGRKNGVAKGMTVFSKNYLIGTVVESNYLTARVLLVTDLNSKIPVLIQESSVNAILTGAGKSTDLMLEYLPEEFVLEPNKIIYTSGRDGFLVAGLQVAETYLNKDNKIIIKPLADPQQASIIYVTNGQLN